MAGVVGDHKFALTASISMGAGPDTFAEYFGSVSCSKRFRLSMFGAAFFRAIILNSHMSISIDLATRASSVFGMSTTR